MSSVNKVILIGNLGRDPELRYTKNGQAVANFSLATSDNFTKDGQKEERTEWHRIVAWGKTAELCTQYLSKGRTVYIEGQLRTRDWEDKEGHKRSTTEVHASTVQFIGPRGAGQGGGAPSSGGAGGGSRSSEPSTDAPPSDDEIPF
jgi:single-strand DNA-binding protein